MKFKKYLSQNFLTNFFYLKNILNFVKPEINTIYLEIGFGRGNLSKYILKKLLCYNFLIYFIEIEKFFYKKFNNFYNINTLNKNILIFNFNIFKKFFFYKFKIFILGNIPYKISSPILFYLIKFIKNVNYQYFLLEKNYFKKITNLKNILSFILISFYKIKNIFILDNLSFFPKPKVKSIFCKFKPLFLSLINLNDLYFLKKFLKFFLKKKYKKFFFKNFLSINNYINLFFRFKKKFLKFKNNYE